MNAYPIDTPLALAITDLTGRFLYVDDQFRALLRLERKDIIGRTILDLTADPFRPLNADKLNELRESGEAFVIRKEYIRGDGTRLPVENSVSLLRDGMHGDVLTAAVRVLPSNAAERFTASIGIARSLLAEQTARAELRPRYRDQDWRLLLAAYLAEAEGRGVWTDELCVAVGGDPRAELLRVWELIKEGSLVVEGPPVSLDRVSVRVSPKDAELIERHLVALVTD